jgi:cytochrome c biogenesis protein CcdA
MAELDVGFALGAGFAAALNPCGVVLLPSYLSYLLGREDVQGTAREGLLAGLLMTAGFVSVFLVAGLPASWIGGRLTELAPWLTLPIGAALVVLGLGLWTDRPLLGLHLPGLQSGLAKRQRPRSLFGIYLYGVAYAVTSLGCALPVFLVVVTRAALAGSFVSSALAFLFYSAGMGAAVTALSVATVLSKGWVTKSLRGAVPAVKKVSAVVVIGSGLFLLSHWLAGRPFP